MEDIYIESYKNNDKFKNRINPLLLSYDEELKTLKKHKIYEDKNIILIFKNEKLIGYSIIFNLKEYSPNSILLFSSNLKEPIPIITLHMNPIYIADFYIIQEEKRKGNGTKMANYILEEYKNEKFSLIADGEGLYFWGKMGFNFINNNSNIMIK